MTGLITRVDRSAIHDGPGIRSLVYMKGCPIRCIWCSSPETQREIPEVLYLEAHCKKCGQCVESCPVGAIELSPAEGVMMDRGVCNDCGACAAVCPNGALKIVGEYKEVEEILAEVERDRPFYRRSNGGVTVTGGEPTMQSEFVSSFLRRCKEKYLHTAMETCGYVQWEALKRIAENLDLIMFDVKHIDPTAHKRLTGVSNEVILGNAKKLSQRHILVIRIPVVPGHNDSEQNIRATAEFAAQLGKNMRRIELLPFHKYGSAKYRQLHRPYEAKDLKELTEEEVNRLKGIVESYGVKAQIGG